MWRLPLRRTRGGDTVCDDEAPTCLVRCPSHCRLLRRHSRLLRRHCRHYRRCVRRCCFRFFRFAVRLRCCRDFVASTSTVNERRLHRFTVLTPLFVRRRRCTLHGVVAGTAVSAVWHWRSSLQPFRCHLRLRSCLLAPWMQEVCLSATTTKCVRRWDEVFTKANATQQKRTKENKRK